MSRSNSYKIPSRHFWGLVAVISILFLMGGSSRSDVESLAILNPAMVLFCGTALLTFRREHWKEKKLWFVGFALLFLLVAFYLIPFSATLSTLSQGGVRLADIRNNANASNSSMPLSIMPVEAWQSFASLFAPLAVFLFAMQLTRDELILTLPIAIFIGAISGILGVLQLAGGSEGPLYLYRITNNGSAVGLFANRNHAAVFLACQFPILAVYAASSHGTRSAGRNMQKLVAMSVAILLVPLILVTGSRAGMLAGLIGMIGGAVLYSSQVHASGLQKKHISRTLVLVGVALLFFVFATIFFARAEAIERLFVDAEAANSRAEFWAPSINIFWKYYPFGFGPGSFAPAFESEESITLLNHTYVNRVHNDWLETALTFGLLGILLMLIGVIYYARRSYLLWFRMDGRRSTVIVGRMASIIIAILGIASLSDYPLRTPAMMAFGTIVLLWFTEARRETKVDAEKSLANGALMATLRP